MCSTQPFLGIKLVFLFIILYSSKISFAKEGVWPPSMIKNREADMRELGLQIPVDILYNNNGTGLNNAVVMFGKGCTGEIISSKGLILTNHHCGYGTVQGLSSMQNDYFAHGFWAGNPQQEIPCRGLTVTFIRRVENVSDKILPGIADTVKDAVRDSIIAMRCTKLEKGYKYTTGMDAIIRPFYNGNQYWVIISETYRDVRLVGFPPNGIGQFGGDAENWSWPRHTGDFSIFRVYAGSGNKPADYAKTNKPYEAKEFFTINAGGYKEGDFTMVYGFPAYTDEYIYSSQLNQVAGIVDPIRVEARTKRLDIWSQSMAQSRDIFLKYTSKRAGVANGWKKWQGEMHGLIANDVLSKKRTYEQEFQQWAQKDTETDYTTGLLSKIQANTEASDNLVRADEYIKESVYGIEFIQQGGTMDKMLQCFRLKMSSDKLHDTLKKQYAAMQGFYKNYDATTDKKVFVALMPMFMEHGAKWVPEYYATEYNVHGNSYARWADDAFSTSMLINTNKFSEFISYAKQDDSVVIMGDPAWQLYHSVTVIRNNKIIPKLSTYQIRSRYLNRLYMASRMRKDGGKEMLYPDANFTLRLSYGKIKGIDPEGPEGYSYQTTLDDVIAHDNPALDEFKVPEKLKMLFKKQDYGKWKVNKTVPVAFIADNHTSGGNSGSPVLNAKGQLIGTNFDRVWEGTMSDYYFDPSRCRNISLDIRYTLFIIEKFGNAGWLLKEMKIVK